MSTIAYDPIQPHYNSSASSTIRATSSNIDHLERPLPILPKCVCLASRIKRACQRPVKYWWAWEFLTAGLSIVAAVVLVVVLSRSDQQPQYNFVVGSTSFSLNAFVAAISTVLRTSLLATVAGPLNQSAWNRFVPTKFSKRRDDSDPDSWVQPGRRLEDLDTFGNAANDSCSSFKVLWRTKGRNLAALGALITILSLAFDTFAQQVLTTESRNVPADWPLDPEHYMPRILHYTDPINKTHGVYGPSNPVEGAVISSIFTSMARPSGTCPTINCEWPATPTFGVCGSCRDVKENLSWVEGNNTSSLTYSLPWAHTSDGVVTFNLSVTDRFTDPPSFDGIIATFGTPFYGSYYEHGRVFKDGQFIIREFYFIGIPPTRYEAFAAKYGGGQAFNATDIYKYIVAHACSWYSCVQAYSGQAMSGHTTQRLEATWDRWRPDSTTGDKFYLLADDDAAKHVSNNNISDFKFTLQQGSTNSLAAPLEALCTGEVALGTRFPAQLHNVPQATAYSPETQGFFTKKFWNASDSSANMNALVESVAESLSAFLLTFVPTESLDNRFAPTVYAETTFVLVRWAWLTFPLGLLIGGHLFLALTIWHTRRLRVRPWKGHRLPLLLADVDDMVKKLAIGGMESRKGLEERVGMLKVRLDYDGGDQIAFRRI
ncbi:hypothetical protein F5Y08DRAFT_312941, partial [Xylaria arbuscula]